jgi:hypothetical protein
MNRKARWDGVGIGIEVNMELVEDDEELAVLQRQLAIVERIVESWRKQLLPHNPKNFALYAEGAIEQADILRREIDEYLASKHPKSPDADTSAAPSGFPQEKTS